MPTWWTESSQIGQIYIHGLRTGGHGFSRADFRPSGAKAGGEQSEPPDRIGITIRTPAGVAGSPRAPPGARWSRRHGFQGFAKSAHPWLSSSRSSGAVGTTEVVA